MAFEIRSSERLPDPTTTPSTSPGAPSHHANNLPKRHISEAPHSDAFFQNGEVVYDPDADWESLQTGNIVHCDGIWRVVFTPRGNTPAIDEPLVSYPRRLGRHVLIDHSGLVPPRGPPLDPVPWQRIWDATRRLLRDADKYRIELDELLERLKSNSTLDPDLAADTLKMAACMGFAEVTSVSGRQLYVASDILGDGFSRRKYLATFSDELLAKSRRIDHLIRHTGTVGSYREELLRGTLRQLLPRHFEASTGFIENCPRQLDIIIWDAARYSPLFRDHEVVVVPTAAVRGIIEVKTTLCTNALDEALEILHEVLRVEYPVTPVFKGIFAFEADYKEAMSVAERIRTFHSGTYGPGRSRAHGYLFQGVTAVCVPRSIFVFQRYRLDTRSAEGFPRPFLYGLEHDWPGDLRTAAFLSELLAHLDLDPEAKQTQRQMFGPIFSELETVQLLDLFGPSWRPQQALAALVKTLTPAGAREYVSRVYNFQAGGIPSSEIATGLQG